MKDRPSFWSRLALAVSSATAGFLGLVGGVYATVHLGLGLHGRYDHYAYGSPVGAALALGGAALGAAVPLVAHRLCRKVGAA
jgi:hypothetical protein